MRVTSHEFVSHEDSHSIVELTGETWDRDHSCS